MVVPVFPCTSLQKGTMVVATLDWMGTSVYFVLNIVQSFSRDFHKVSVSSVISEAVEYMTYGLLCTYLSAHLYLYAEKKSRCGIFVWLVITLVITSLNLLKYIYAYNAYMIEKPVYVGAILIIGCRMYEMFVVLLFFLEMVCNCGDGEEESTSDVEINANTDVEEGTEGSPVQLRRK